jgi:hypothetical protein
LNFERVSSLFSVWGELALEVEEQVVEVGEDGFGFGLGGGIGDGEV